jgi:hypothetical protein
MKIKLSPNLKIQLPSRPNLNIKLDANKPKITPKPMPKVPASKKDFIA